MLIAGALAAGCAPGTNPTAPQTMTLRVKNDQFTGPDPAAGPVRVGAGYAFSDDLQSQDGRPAGRDGGSCQVVHVEAAQITTTCVLSIALTDGQLQAQALWVRGSTPLTMAITGGTGAYDGAKGVLTAVDIQTPNETYQINLTG